MPLKIIHGKLLSKNMKHSTTKETQIICSLCSLGLGFKSTYPEELFRDLTENDWANIYKSCTAQGVVSVAYDGIQLLSIKHQPDLETNTQWAFNVVYGEKIFQKQKQCAEHFIELMNQHNINAVILKGLTSSGYYPKPNHRQFGDLDVYLMGDYKKANAIIKDMGIPVKYDFFVHSEFLFEKINIENHHVFINNRVNKYAKHAEAFIESRLEKVLPNSMIKSAFELDPTANAAFLLRHASWHYARECIRLRDIIDWTMFLHAREDSIDKSELEGMLKETGLERFFGVLTTLSFELFGFKSKFYPQEDYTSLSERVLDDIITFFNPHHREHNGVLKTFLWKIENRFSRKWCYDEVVPDSFWGNIFYSAMVYLREPSQIFKSKV